jgi:glycosyltransferase involved in cell wall biosynthesis
MKDNFLIENPLKDTPIDVAVGIPSYNEADNIGFVAAQVGEGLRKYFPDRRTAIINADNYSEDGTKDVFLEADSKGVQKVYLSTPEGVKGKGNNFLNLFEYLNGFKPKAVAVVDADLISIGPEWVEALVKPVFEGYEFVSPYYARNEYDGTITNHLCYPLLYGLLGKNIRQPIGGDFAFSGKLIDHWLATDWTESIRQYGVDIFMTLGAVLAGYSTAQTSLGAKIHKPSAPKLGKMFTQVVDTLFRELLGSKEQWCLNGSRPLTPPVFDNNGYGLCEPQDLEIDYKVLKRQALTAYEKTNGNARSVLPEELAAEIHRMFEKGRLRIGAPTWAEIVFSHMDAYENLSSQKERLRVVEGLKPFYFGRVVSFIRETLELDHSQSEQKIVRQARVFWKNRGRLTATACPD